MGQHRPSFNINFAFDGSEDSINHAITLLRKVNGSDRGLTSNISAPQPLPDEVQKEMPEATWPTSRIVGFTYTTENGRTFDYRERSGRMTLLKFLSLVHKIYPVNGLTHVKEIMTWKDRRLVAQVASDLRFVERPTKFPVEEFIEQIPETNTWFALLNYSTERIEEIISAICDHFGINFEEHIRGKKSIRLIRQELT